jgi:hypothetical protein
VHWPRPRVALALFCVLILIGSAFHHGHSVESMDVRTYAQMIRGVAEHGLPYWDNGPVDRFPQLVVPHGTPAGGHVWGIYSPLYAYVYAPVFKLGGLSLVSRLTFALLVPLAIATFLLARRVVKDEWYATFAAVIAVIGTPALSKALEITSFPLTVLLTTLATYFTVRIIQEREVSWRVAAACGASWAFASSAHVLSFPMGAAALLVLAIAPHPETGERGVTIARARLGPTLAGYFVATLPVCLLNHLRFNSWNPISYGKPPFSGPPEMTLGAQLRYIAPVIALGVVVLVVLFFVRKNKKAILGVLAIAAVAAIVMEPLRERFLRFATIACGYIVDISRLDMAGGEYKQLPDGIGTMTGGYVVKSTLQGTPLLFLAPLSLSRAGDKRWPLIAILLPCVALYASFLTRANMSNVHAFGWPWVYQRYAIAALPALVVASMVVVERIGMTRSVLVDGLLLAIILGYVVWDASDERILRRLAVLYLPLLLGVLACGAAAFFQHRASRPRVLRMLVSLAAGLSIAIAIGHDFRAQTRGKYWCDYWVDQFNAVAPPRFAFIGFFARIDVLLTTTATHDVRYIALGDIAAQRPLIDYWRAEDRPILLLWPSDPPPIWPDITYSRLEGMPDVYRLNFK